MRRRGKTFLSLFLSAVIVTGQPVLAADFSAGEETFISETTEQEGDVSEASAIFEDTVDSDSEMRYEKYEATVSSEILDLGQAGVNGGGWERLLRLILLWGLGLIRLLNVSSRVISYWQRLVER